MNIKNLEINPLKIKPKAMSKNTSKLLLLISFFTVSVTGNANSSLPCGNEPVKKYTRQNPPVIPNAVYRLNVESFILIVKEKFQLAHCEANYINGHAYLDLQLQYMGTWCDTYYTGFNNWYCHDQLYIAYLQATSALYYQYLACEGAGIPIS